MTIGGMRAVGSYVKDGGRWRRMTVSERIASAIKREFSKPLPPGRGPFSAMDRIVIEHTR